MRIGLRLHWSLLTAFFFTIFHIFVMSNAQAAGPIVTIDTPTEDSTFENSIVTLSGFVTDTNGSGIDRVKVAIYELDRKLHYSPSSGEYSRFPAITLATLNNSEGPLTSWTLQFVLEGAGSYRAFVRATDLAGNQSFTGNERAWNVRNFNVVVEDSEPPIVDIDIAAAEFVNNGRTFYTIGGSVSDNGGSGISAVKLGIYDTVSHRWFDFSTGDLNNTGQRIRFAPLDSTALFDNRWSSTIGVLEPSAGPFRVYVRAVDRNGNQSTDPMGRGWTRRVLSNTLD